MASTVTISQSPGDYNLAYGPNPVTLSNLTTGATKYVLQVRTVGGDILADIRQTANAQGKAIFDIQNILQTYVHVSPINTEQLGLGSISPANLQDSTQEVERYVLRIGDETNGTVDLVTASMGPYNVIGGKKPWYDLNWAEENAAKVKSDCLLFLQPEWSKRDKVMPFIVEYVMKHPKWKVSLQTHKYLNIP